MAYGTKDFRNFVLLGHGDSGKTAFLDALAFKAGASSRHGSSADGTSISDTEPEEVERKHTLSSHLFFVPHKKTAFHVFDSPGYPDFIAEAISALHAVETAVLVVSSAGGVTFNARKLWKEAEKAGVARAILVTRPEAENTDFSSLLEELVQTFGDVCVPVTYPDANGKAFSKVFRVLEGEGDKAGDYRAVLEERVVEVDEALMEKYFEEGALSTEALEEALPRAMTDGKVVPVFTAVPPSLAGVEEFLEFASRFFPSPIHRGEVSAYPKEGDEASEKVAPDPSGPLAAQVVKVLSDPHVGKLSFLRVRRGTLEADSSLWNVRTGKSERVGHILKVHGKERKQVEKALAGEIVAVAKVESLEYGDTICDPEHPLRFPLPQQPQAMVSRAVFPKQRGDEQKIAGALARISSEDPTFLTEREPSTGELLVKGLSELHLGVQIERIKNRYKLDLEVRLPKVPYQETVTARAEGHHRHKKQTGGRGQFGEVYLRIFPKDRGEGFEFVDKVVGGNIPRQFIPEVEKGIVNAMKKGVIAGYPVVDVGVEVYDGKHHPVDSDQFSFQIAGAKAFAEAFEKAKPVLLEPIMNLTIEVPTRFTGDITANLNTKRGRLTGMDAHGDIQVIQAQVPLKEALDYSAQLRSITAGEGSFTMEFSHYEPVPGNVQQEIVAAYLKEKESGS